MRQFGSATTLCETCGGAGELNYTDAKAREIVKKAADLEAKELQCTCQGGKGSCTGACGMWC